MLQQTFGSFHSPLPKIIDAIGTQQGILQVSCECGFAKRVSESTCMPQQDDKFRGLHLQPCGLSILFFSVFQTTLFIGAMPVSFPSIESLSLAKLLSSHFLHTVKVRRKRDLMRSTNNWGFNGDVVVIGSAAVRQANWEHAKGFVKVNDVGDCIGTPLRSGCHSLETVCYNESLHLTLCSQLNNALFSLSHLSFQSLQTIHAFSFLQPLDLTLRTPGNSLNILRRLQASKQFVNWGSQRKRKSGFICLDLQRRKSISRSRINCSCIRRNEV